MAVYMMLKQHKLYLIINMHQRVYDNPLLISYWQLLGFSGLQQNTNGNIKVNMAIHMKVHSRDEC